MPTRSSVTHSAVAAAVAARSANALPHPVGMHKRVVGDAVGGQNTPRRVDRYFHSIVNSLETGIVVLDYDARIEWRNPAAARILGTQADELVYQLAGKANNMCIYDAEGGIIPINQRPIARTRLTGTAMTAFVIGVDRIDGQRVWLLASCCLLEPGDPVRSSLLFSYTDITSGHLASQRLGHEATHDALTGLPNRAHVLARMSHALDSGNVDELAAVLFIDLDNLKLINDSLGHEAGDTALRVAAQRLRGAVRPGDLIARLGGDEFVALVVGPVARADLDRLSERLHARLAEPVTIAGVSVRLGASIGIAEVEQGDRRDAAEILREADLAMYHVKANGGGKTHRFTPTSATAAAKLPLRR